MLVSSILFAFLQLSSFAVWNVRGWKYDIVLSEKTMKEIHSYKTVNKVKLGKNLKQYLPTTAELSDENLIEALLRTKMLKGSSKKDIKLGVSDWTKEEFQYLSDISIAVDVNCSNSYENEINEVLIFANGPLLKSENVNWFKVTPDREDSTYWYRLKICESKYYELIKRRFLPVFKYINNRATVKNEKAIVSIPCLGCDPDSAGRFHSNIGNLLNAALQSILGEHIALGNLKNIAAVYYFPLEKFNIEDSKTNLVQKPDISQASPTNFISYFTRPASSKLNLLQDFKGQVISVSATRDFRTYEIFEIIESDPIACPGNPNFDRRKQSAKTNYMQMITDVDGVFDSNGDYIPPNNEKNYENWAGVMEKERIYLHAHENVRSLGSDD